MLPPTAAVSFSRRTSVLEAAATLNMVAAGPCSAAALISHLCNPRLGADELAAKIESHPVLCARVLQIANSPYYGQSRTVGTVRRALLVLGLNAVRAIAAAACIDQVVPHRTTALHDISALVRHGIATAIACEQLALLCQPHMASDAFIAGLIHNLGVLIQATLEPAATLGIIAARTEEPKTAIRLLEQRQGRLGHEECGAILFSQWELPEGLIAAVQYHHDPDDAPQTHRMLPALVCAGASMALQSRFTYSLEPAAVVDDELTTARLQLQPQDFENIRAHLPEQVELLSRALG